jgi:hypothetical protein
MLQNYTSDLLFGMERLSTSPYSVKRLQPTDSLPFTVDNAASISGQSLEALLAGNRLFFVDYSSFKDLPLSAGKYAAACQAYFYIHPQSGDFLPLAIKTNVGSDLTYTPEDSENDWLLAKMLFNINDGFNQEFEHFAASHWVAEIAYLAAIRTLSEEHPIMPIVHRRKYLHGSHLTERLCPLTPKSDEAGLGDASCCRRETPFRRWPR